MAPIVYGDIAMIEQFKSAMDAAGLVTSERITPDGKLHRIRIDGDAPGKRNAWYVLYGDGLPAGSFGCWKRQISQTWCMKSDRQMTAAERQQFRQRMEAVKQARQAEEQARRDAARVRARDILTPAPSAPDSHPYLVKKKVKAHGLALYKGCLVVPLYDRHGLQSLQFIDADGNKRFLSGGKIHGCYFTIDVPVDELCICEGYATGASIYEATGHAVAVAFNAGNLLPVARAMRIKYPGVEITVCADNDEKTEGNPGLTKAREAALFIGAALAVPPCAGDWNDFYNGVSK